MLSDIEHLDIVSGKDHLEREESELTLFVGLKVLVTMYW